MHRLSRDPDPRSRLVCISGGLAIAEGTVTALKVQARNKDRVNVYLDGEFGFGVVRTLAAKLQVGDYLTEADVESLQQDAVEEARKRALRLIARRPRSTAELRHYFERREVAEAIQQVVIDSLTEAGLVDDRSFAQTWVENRTEFRPRGAFALRQELKQKGVGREAIEAALEDFDEQEAARKAAHKAAGRYKHLSEQEFRRKVGAYLQRRGFPYGLISAAVEAAWQQAAEGHESEGTLWT